MTTTTTTTNKKPLLVLVTNDDINDDDDDHDGWCSTSSDGFWQMVGSSGFPFSRYLLDSGGIPLLIRDKNRSPVVGRCGGDSWQKANVIVHNFKLRGVSLSRIPNGERVCECKRKSSSQGCPLGIHFYGIFP